VGRSQSRPTGDIVENAWGWVLREQDDEAAGAIISGLAIWCPNE
jgi:hypothetical protein